MMSSEQIARLADEAAARAERKNTRPRVFGSGKMLPGQVPFIGTYRPADWQLVEREELELPSSITRQRLMWLAAKEPYLMVDASGFGARDEPALTIGEFGDLVKANANLGWAVVEAGQFQVVVGAFRKLDDAPAAHRVPRMNKEDLATAFAKGKPGKCHNADTDGKRYRLHASDIATRLDDGTVLLDWCGYYTPTTASHMNAILWALGSTKRVSYATDRDAGVTTFTA